LERMQAQATVKLCHQHNLEKNVDSILVSDDCCQGRLWLIGESKNKIPFQETGFLFSGLEICGKYYLCHLGTIIIG
jgi:hypothetical protein